MANDITVQTQRAIDENVMGSLTRLQNEGLVLPQGYSAQNALKAAYFDLVGNSAGNLIQMSANNEEMKASIANALLDLVIQGLSTAKKQAYFIKYGNKVQLMRSYFGTIAVLKRLTGAEVEPVIVHEGDVFEVKMTGPQMEVVKHETKFENLDNPIVAAYCVITLPDGSKSTTVMTKNQIDASWAKAKTKNVQNEFPEDMAKRTVINKAAKYFINTSDDNDLLVESLNHTTDNEFDFNQPSETPKAKNLAEKFKSMKTAEPAPEEPAEVMKKKRKQEKVTDGPVDSKTSMAQQVSEILGEEVKSDDEESTEDADQEFQEKTGEQTEFNLYGPEPDRPEAEEDDDYPF